MQKVLVTEPGQGTSLAIAKALFVQGATVAVVAQSTAELKSALSSIGRKSNSHTAFALNLAKVREPRTRW